MKSRNNNINKAQKQMFEVKSVISYSLLETGCDLCLQRLSYKPIEKILKIQSSKTQNYSRKQTFSKITLDLRLQQKAGGLSFSTSGSQLDQLIMRLSHEPT